MNSRVAVWLQEHFSFFTQEPLFKDLLRLLEGKMRERGQHISRDMGVVIDNEFGTILYDKLTKVGRCIIEQVEFIPCRGKGFAFTVVDNELSIVRRNGSDPEYSPKMCPKEMAEISVFVNQLRLKTEEFLKARI